MNLPQKDKNMETKKVWLVTGASKGLGLVLINKLLASGYSVAATSRNIEVLQEAVIVNTATKGNFLPLEVDLVDEKSVENAIQKTHETFGRLDVIVNNAGYGIGGTLEELTQEEILQSFNINVFGTVNVIQKAMPYLRAQRSGYFINISSIAGFAPAIGWSIYSAAKHAIVGLSEVLAEDVKSLGIKVTVVAPGAFRTQFLSEDSLVMSKNKIDDYKEVQESHARYKAMNGTQLGDPEKAAEVFINLAEDENPPVRLYLGSDSYKRASNKMETLASDMEKWKSVSFSTDFTN